MGFEVSAVCLEMDVLLPQTIGHLDEHLEKSNCSCCWCYCHWPKQIGRREVALKREEQLPDHRRRPHARTRPRATSGDAP